MGCCWQLPLGQDTGHVLLYLLTVDNVKGSRGARHQTHEAPSRAGKAAWKPGTTDTLEVIVLSQHVVLPRVAASEPVEIKGTPHRVLLSLSLQRCFLELVVPVF